MTDGWVYEAGTGWESCGKIEGYGKVFEPEKGVGKIRVVVNVYKNQEEEQREVCR